ncbi:T9SS type A sorting domain-containing protein [uncultured Cyclobacterium sp.]|uniref:T9SS type A sorting domain-containing protein n=1 Tax=uncultured Cyclobacterium sp. TaxID=453820 RepID=UPI0030ED5823|tara:strand:- start:80464 stop:82449 length:1986 start_codon:yes stop_codon:yes gene_type:complete
MKQSYLILSFIFLLTILPNFLIYAHNGVPDDRVKEFESAFVQNNSNQNIKLDPNFFSGETTFSQRMLSYISNLNYSIAPAVDSFDNHPGIEEGNIPVPTTITFLEYVVNGIVGQETCLTATLKDQFGVPMSNEEVIFYVNGSYYGTFITDENGKIVFCQTPDVLGDLIVTAYAEGGESTEATIIAGEVSEDLKIESFWLVDASTNSVISEITDGDKIPYSSIKDRTLTIVVSSDPEIVGSVKMEMEYLTSCPSCPAKKHTITENIVPYALYGDVKGQYVGHAFSPGTYSLMATPYETRFHTGNPGMNSMINFEVVFDSIIETFTLVNATDDTDIREIKDGDIIDLSSFTGNKFNVRANVPLNQVQGGVGMEISGPVNHSQFEKVKPYALLMDDNGDYAGKELPEGNYTLTGSAFPFNSSVNTGIGGESLTVNFEVVHKSKVDKLVLVNADTDQDIMTILDGAYIDLNQLKEVKLNIRAEGKGNQIAAMAFQLSGAKNYNWTERKAPYAIYGDLPGDDYNGKHFSEGKYKLMVTPYNSNNVMGERLTVNFVAGFDIGNNLRVNVEAINQLESLSSEKQVNLESLEEELKVYPQPSQNFVNIVYPSILSDDETVMIYKGNGLLIHSAQLGNTANFNFKSFGAGLYVIQVTNSEKVFFKKVFIY